jgi:hypothetical protein
MASSTAMMQRSFISMGSSFLMVWHSLMYPIKSGPEYKHHGLNPTSLKTNIKENSENRKRPKHGHKRLFNQMIHDLRDRVEQTFAWEDKFNSLLLRFERI